MSNKNTEGGDLASPLKKLNLDDAKQKSNASEGEKLQKGATSLDEEENFDYFWEDNFEEDKIEELDVQELHGAQKVLMEFFI